MSAGRPPVGIGDRVRITGPMNDPDPLPVGAEGTVDWVNTWRSIYTEQIGIECDNGRSLILLGSDSFAVIARASDGSECA
jgi:hypothetical protein